MKIYLVGGAVRDKYLNRPIIDKDYVVVGSTIDEMLLLGYKQVGQDFPVFLHPKTKEEYALARKEKKIGTGYYGFDCECTSVTLDEDLYRRDLTINAMAMSIDSEELIDPYNGYRDLQEKKLRHVSKSFKEDPVRILRIARFLARYSHLGFTIADETIEMMKLMVNEGDIDFLIPERVWKEMVRALGEPDPWSFFNLLDEIGGLEKLMYDIYDNQKGIEMIKETKTDNALLNFAIIMHDIEVSKISTFCNQYHLPNEFKELAEFVSKEYKSCLMIKPNLKDNLEDYLRLYQSCPGKAYHRTDLFEKFVVVIDLLNKYYNKDDRFNKDEIISDLKYLVVESRNITKELINSGKFKSHAFSSELENRRLKKLMEHHQNK